MSDYPNDKDLKQIAKWSHKDFKGLMEFIENLWHFRAWGWHKKGRTYYISTGGWSGNELIIDVMKENFTFWTLCWVSHRRGGHYVFRLPTYKIKDIQLKGKPD